METQEKEYLEKILSKAIDITLEKGHYEMGKWWQVYSEKKPDGKYLKILPKYSTPFEIIYEKVKNIFGGSLNKNVTIYDRGRPVFRANSISYKKGPVTEDEQSTFKIDETAYRKGDWEQHLFDL